MILWWTAATRWWWWWCVDQINSDHRAVLIEMLLNWASFRWMTGSRVPARHAEESHQRRQNSREDEAGQTGGGRQPDAAGQEGQDQEQPAEAGGAGEGGPPEPLPGPDQRHRQGRETNKLMVSGCGQPPQWFILTWCACVCVCVAGHQESEAVSSAPESGAGPTSADEHCAEFKDHFL